MRKNLGWWTGQRDIFKTVEYGFSGIGFLEIRQGYWRSFGSIPVGSTHVLP